MAKNESDHNPVSNRDSVTRKIAFDCRFFMGDRPCTWHKATGVLCPCDHYQRVEERLLIIKVDAMGDVLRTAALLPALAEAHPCASITWVTRRESRPLPEHNLYINYRDSRLRLGCIASTEGSSL